MSGITINGAVYVRGDTTANWVANNPVLGNKEIGLDLTVLNFKVGDGTTAWNSLPYWIPGFASTKVPFTTTGAAGYTLAWDAAHVALYGNNPILQVYTLVAGKYDEDFQTPAQITYNTAGDQTSGIASIYYDYGQPTTGFLQITGIRLAGSAGTSTSGGSSQLTFDQTSLVLDSGSQQYYLPLTLTGSKRPFYVESNSVELTTQYDRSVTPARLYGFANNAPQSIIVTVI